MFGCSQFVLPENDLPSAVFVLRFNVRHEYFHSFYYHDN